MAPFISLHSLRQTRGGTNFLRPNKFWLIWTLCCVTPCSLVEMSETSQDFWETTVNLKTRRLANNRKWCGNGRGQICTWLCCRPYPDVGTAVAQWLRCCATNQKVAGSIPACVSGFFVDIKSFRSHYGPGVDSASNRNEYQEYFLGVKAAGA